MQRSFYIMFQKNPKINVTAPNPAAPAPVNSNIVSVLERSPGFIEFAPIFIKNITKANIHVIAPNPQ